MSVAPTIVANADGTCHIEWNDDDRAPFYEVSPEIIEQMVVTHNELVALKAKEPGAPASQDGLPACNDQDMPDTDRVPTEADLLMAGQLSTVWPMCHRHPEDAIHLAIYVNDLESDGPMSLVRPQSEEGAT